LFKLCLFLTVVGGIAAAAYIYLRLDDEICRQVESVLAEHYPAYDVHVSSARFEQDRGISVAGVSISEKNAAADNGPILTIDELYLTGKLRLDELLTGRLNIAEIHVRRPTLRAKYGADGTWNVSGLFPPPNLSEQSPNLTIEDASFVLLNPHPGAKPWELRGV
jgi:hypothetical protein